jgi:Sulfotransferase family
LHTGHIDSADHYAINGWAADTDRPDARVLLRIMVNGIQHGQVIAERPRRDLLDIGKYGDGAHGFIYVFDPPLLPLHAYNVVVHVIDPPGDVPNGRFRLNPIRSRDVPLKPLLLTATGRSGTTLLMRRLGNSQEIVLADMFPFEMKLLTYYGYALEVLTTASSVQNREALDQLTEDPYHLGLNPFHHPDMEALYPKPFMLHQFFGPRAAERLHPTFRSIIDDFYRDMRTYAHKPCGRFFAEKCDMFTPARNFARLAFDGVKELLLVRDLRDVYCSRRAFWSDSSEKALQNLKTVQDTVLPILSAEQEHMLVLRYEDLVRQPAETLSRISAYLGLDQSIELNTDSERKTFSSHSTSADPESSIGRWKHELNAESRVSISKSFKPFLEALGYDVADE